MCRIFASFWGRHLLPENGNAVGMKFKTHDSRADFGDDDEGSPDFIAEINITPLTDVFLVLLIIFMVTSSVMSQLGLNVTLPKASNSVSGAELEGVILTLKPNGSMVINGTETIAAGEWVNLKVKLSAAFELSKSRVLILEADEKAFVGGAIKILDIAKQAGANDYSIATRVDEAQP